MAISGKLGLLPDVSWFDRENRFFVPT